MIFYKLLSVNAIYCFMVIKVVLDSWVWIKSINIYPPYLLEIGNAFLYVENYISLWQLSISSIFPLTPLKDLERLCFGFYP